MATRRPLPASLAPASDPALGDLRFRRLLSDTQWNALPAAVQARFTKRVSRGDSSLYAGEVIDTRMNLMGKTLAQALRVIGGPLPLETLNAGVAATVVVTEDAKGNGQFWSRQYGRRSGFPQVIQSTKLFQGPTGLEEHVGAGIGMTLRLDVDDGTLLFKADQYFLEAMGLRIYLPKFMTPGHLTVEHHDLGNGQFEFTINLTHKVFGTLLDQRVIFRDI